MEFNEKLQQLRHQKGLTQEELADILFVSRTAVSKWESGRGYPSIDSLKAISKYFSLSIDDLLSGEELLSVAEEDSRQREGRIRSLVFSLFDIFSALFFFLPLFRQEAADSVMAVSLLSLKSIEPYLSIIFIFTVTVTVVFGVFSLVFLSLSRSSFGRKGQIISLCLSAFSSLLFILCFHPYAAAFSFVILLIKALILINRR